MKHEATFALVLFVYVMSLYPAVLESTQQRGFDAPIYYHALRGETHETSIPTPGYVYSDRLLPVFAPMGALPYPAFLLLLHLGNALGLAACAHAALSRRHDHPRLAWAAALAIGYLASDIVCGGNVTALLAGLSLTPIGALAVAAVKPWAGAMVLVLHALVWADRRYRGVLRDGARCGVSPRQLDLVGGGFRNVKEMTCPSNP